MSNIHFTHIEVQCRHCGGLWTLDGGFTTDQYQAWRSGTYIQDAMPHLSADDRELLISQICPECWLMLFPPDEDEET